MGEYLHHLTARMDLYMAFGMKLLSHKGIGIDMGTMNTVISHSEQGIVLREPSLVALNQREEIVAVGSDAMHMLGRAPQSIHVVRPIEDGIVANTELCELMLRWFIDKAFGAMARRIGLRAVLCVPGGMTEVERCAVEEAAHGAGLRSSLLLDVQVAAALGAGLPVDEAVGSMVVDIGAGNTNAAVMALGGIVQKCTVKTGGNHIDRAIVEQIREQESICIGTSMAEWLKVQLIGKGDTRGRKLCIRGQDQANGFPRSMQLDAGQVHQMIRQPLQAILGCIRDVLSKTPPELAADLYDHGIFLTGGSAQLYGLGDALQKLTGMQVSVAPNPMESAALGACVAAEQMAYYKSRAV